ncbi:MAG: membrane protein insertase YidC [Myxococcales bacterium]|nr:membrane protein insertase YidC [Myxococcales bacterium]
MEDQGKRLTLAVAIVAVMWAVYLYVVAPPPPAPTAPAVAPAVAPAPIPGPVPVGVPATAGAPAPAAAGVPALGGAAVAGLGADGSGVAVAAGANALAAPAVVRCDVATAQTAELQGSGYVATISACGGGLAHFRISAAQYEQRVRGRKPEPLDLVRTGERAELFPLQVSLPGAVVAIPAGSTWRLSSPTADEVLATFESPTLAVERRLKAVPGKYALEISIRVTNRQPAGAIDVPLGISVTGRQAPGSPERGMFTYAPPTWGAACYLDGELRAKAVGDLSETADARTGDVRWAGVAHKYFLFAVAGRLEPSDRLSCSLRRVPDAEAGMTGTMAALLQFPAFRLGPGESASRHAVVYAGPKLVEDLEQVSGLGKVDAELDRSVDLGFFGWLARPMLSLLQVFHGVFGNWGFAIILLTITVKLATLYWTHKSMKSMKRMGQLKPKIDALRAKYPDDKQRQNVEMMNLYKAEKINPLGGCLPMLLQMPVWFALYQTLDAAAELYQAPFIGWIHDLTAPDPYYVVPALMTAVMFVQQKMTPSTMDAAQQKMMLYMMPILFGGMSFVFPAGLTIYILTNTMLSMAHQRYLNRDDRATASPRGASVGGVGQSKTVRT